MGNPTAGIFLSLGRMSTVKIRAGSLFHTPLSRIGAAKAVSDARASFKRQPDNDLGRRNVRQERFSSALHRPSQFVHRRLVFRTCGKRRAGAKSENTILEGLKNKADAD